MAFNCVKSIFFFSENSIEDLKREREEKKRYLLRKLSFRPTIEELKCRKVSKQLLTITAILILV